MPNSHPNRIIVPSRPIQGGFDNKFETDPYDVKLHGVMTSEQYKTAMEAMNKRLRPSRSSAVDGALLAAGPLMVPLMWWGIRHRNQTRRRKRLLKKAIDEFNAENPTLLMRWNRRPQSFLSIERRPSDEDERFQQQQQQLMQQDQTAMAHAELVSDVIAHVEEMAPQHSQQQHQQQLSAAAPQQSAMPQQSPTPMSYEQQPANNNMNIGGQMNANYSSGHDLI